MWNNPYLNSYTKRRNLIQAYNFHQINLENIHKQKTPIYIDNKIPNTLICFVKHTLNTKPQKNIEYYKDIENKSLFKKMIHIDTNHCAYSKQNCKPMVPNKPKTLHWPKRHENMVKMIKENELIEKRIQNAKKTINSNSFKTFFDQSRIYAKNIKKFPTNSTSFFMLPENINTTLPTNTSTPKKIGTPISAKNFKIKTTFNPLSIQTINKNEKNNEIIQSPNTQISEKIENKSSLMKDKDEIINMSEIKESATLVDKEKFESKKSLPPEEPIESANLNENNSGNFLNNEKNILSPQIEEKINT